MIGSTLYFTHDHSQKGLLDPEKIAVWYNTPHDTHARVTIARKPYIIAEDNWPCLQLLSLLSRWRRIQTKEQKHSVFGDDGGDKSRHRARYCPVSGSWGEQE